MPHVSPPFHPLPAVSEPSPEASAHDSFPCTHLICRLSFTYMKVGRATACSSRPGSVRDASHVTAPAPPAQFCRKRERSVSPVPGASEERAAAFVREALEERDDYEQHDLARSVREASHPFKKCDGGVREARAVFV